MIKRNMFFYQQKEQNSWNIYRTSYIISIKYSVILYMERMLIYKVSNIY